jgi:hypothetical protein
MIKNNCRTNRRNVLINVTLTRLSTGNVANQNRRRGNLPIIRKCIRNVAIRLGQRRFASTKLRKGPTKKTVENEWGANEN